MMLTYSSTNSFQSDDRTADFSKPALQSSPSHLAGRTLDHGFLEFDVTDDAPVDYETALNSTNAGEHGYDRVVVPNTSRRRRFPPASLRSTQSEEVLPSQASRRCNGFENQRGAISGAELLKLEGKIPGQTVPLTLPLKSLKSPSAVAGVTPTLRRKSRFSTETMRQRNHQISKSGADRPMNSPRTVRASYRYQKELISSLEWTQENHEQIILHDLVSSPPVTSLPLSSPGAYPYLEQQTPRHLNFARHQKARSKEIANPAHIPQQQPSTEQITSPSTHSLNLIDHPNWPPDSIYSCYGKFGPSHSAPSLAQPQSKDLCSTHTGMTQAVHQYHDRVVADHPPHNDFYLVTGELFESRSASANVLPATFPAAADATPSPCTPSFQLPHSPHLSNHHRGPSRTSRRESSAASLRSSNNNGTMIGFVNYTPGDSQKILAGVAPSGSSKTKAKREQEALERKRKLSLAAEKAVKEAGGDLEPLRASGLLM